MMLQYSVFVLLKSIIFQTYLCYSELNMCSTKLTAYAINATAYYKGQFSAKILIKIENFRKCFY